MNNRGLSLGLVLLLLITGLAPLASGTSARTTPDFTITSFTLENAGSITSGGEIIVEDSTHTVRVQVQNIGSAAGEVSLTLYHQGSLTSGESIVQTVDLGVMAAGVSSNVILLEWTGTIGDDQTLSARVSSTTDSNINNNEQSMLLQVRNYQEVSVLNTVGFPSSGTPVVWPKTTIGLNVNLMNEGVKAFSASFSLSFVDPLNAANNFEILSGTIPVVNPGSLAAGGATAETITLDFDASAYTGNFEVTGTLVTNGVAWTKNTVFLDAQSMRFSDYHATLTPAQDRSTEPGQTTTLTYLIKNEGLLNDGYDVAASSLNTWADLSADTSTTATISPGATTAVLVPVTVPADAAMTDSETVTITLTSTEDPSASYTASTTVLAGESYEVVVTMPAVSQQLIPGQPTDINVNIENTGNAPAPFMLTSGLTSTPDNWDLSLSTPTTPIMMPGVSRDIVLTVTPPTIKFPRATNENTQAGSSMGVWVQAQSVYGGMPGIDSTPIEIRPVIAVDPGLPTDSIVMTVEEVMAARAGVGLEEFMDLEIQVRHNLVVDLTETVDASIAIGAITFTSDSTGGFNEATRWNSGISPTAFMDLELDSSDTTPAIFTLQGPNDNYPVSGTLEIPITVTPTLGAAHSGSNVIASTVTQTITVEIPPVLGYESYSDGILEADVGEETPFNLNFSNDGNNMTSYRLSMKDTLPINWVTSFSDTGTMRSTTILSLPADVADFPDESELHVSTYDLYVTTDQYATANTIEYLGIRVTEVDSGAFIGEFDIPIRVGEKVNAALSPTNQSINLTALDSIATRIVVSNVGNTPAEFNVWMDTADAGEVTFLMETPSQFQIGAGYDETIRIRLTASADARADELYMATVWVSNEESGLNLSANVVGNISENRVVGINTPTSIGVIPGTSETVDYNITNIGNLAENIIIETYMDSGWTVTPSNITLGLEIGDITDGSFTIDVPSLGAEDELLNGAIYPVIMRVLDPTSYEVLENHSFNLVVSPLFIVEAEEWPSLMEYHPNGARTWSVYLTNTGNKDVTVNISYALTRGGLTTPTSDWQISNTAPTQLALPRDVPVEFKFSVMATEPEPDLTFAADLKVLLTPVDISVEGNAEFYTSLRMSRFFEFSDTKVTPPTNDGPSSYEIPYSHIPNGPADTVAYELELCGSERLVNLASLGLNESDYLWSFSVNVDGVNYPLDLAQTCGASSSLGEDSRITLPARTSYTTANPIQIIIDAPNRPNILAGDGWDLTMRLYHPNENVGYSEFDEATFTYTLAVFADPSITKMGPIGGELLEGVTQVYEVEVTNEGTAMAIGVGVVLDCPGVVVGEPSPAFVDVLGASATVTFQWNVTADTINWWDEAESSSCTATIESIYMVGNDEANDVKTIESNVYSWTPGLSIAFVSCVVAALVAFAFVRLSGQSEKWQLGGIYLGLISFGFAFHLFNINYWGPSVLILSALWLWRMTWKSSAEFRLIHEDYQRARKGVSTVYSDHFQALSDGRRQLTLILALPILGMMAIVLGLPPQLDPTRDNLVSLVVFFGITIFGVWYLLKRSDKMYGNLYGRLTDAEIKAIRIERDLGDPARLLNDLANDGLDLSNLLSPGDSSSTIEEIDDIVAPQTEPITIDIGLNEEVEPDV
ncbi:MAG: hypothetical protein L7S56_04370 [Candidatus Poseidonia sp.]|nr:hypothetical protein [Poseidonia sp.]